MTENTFLQTVVKNLEDAGCDTKKVQEFLALEEKQDEKEQLKLLALHRKKLLDTVHKEEKRIDYLDYLVYKLTHRKSDL